jgi:hypothetical protein
MEAMKKTFLAAGLVVVFGSGLVGCKTTPKLAFWKKDAAADATAVAHSAPALPSDLAKQSATGATSVAQSRLSEAAPFVPGQVARASSTAVAPASYPSTDAPPFTPDVATRIASSAPTTSTSAPVVQTATAPSSHLGSIAAAPYNPAATPAPAAPQVATTSAPESRYVGAQTPSAPLYGQPPFGAIAGASNATPTEPATSNALADAPAYGAPGALSAGERYGSVAATMPTGPTGRYDDVTGASASIPVTQGTTATQQTASTSVATSTQPYRPGGTGSYASGGTLSGSQPAARLASRPQDTSAAQGTSGTTVPNVARPSGAGVTTPAATTPATTPGRYW